MLKFTLLLVSCLLLPGAECAPVGGGVKSKVIETLNLDNVDDDAKAKIGGVLTEIKAVNDEGLANDAEDKAAGQEPICTGEGGDLEPSEQGKVDRILQRFKGTAISKFLVKRVIKVQLKNPNSLFRKLLGRAAQDPGDADFDDGDVETGRPIPSNLLKFVTVAVGETRTVIGYLWKFGFIPKVMNKSPNAADNYNGTIPPCAVTNAIKEFQKFNQITPVDGRLTRETRALMANDRCGNADVECETEECKAEAAGDADQHLRKKRYVPAANKWNTDPSGNLVLYYYFHNYLSEEAARENGRVVLSKDRVRRQVELGFESWTQYAPILFKETEQQDQADINIKFVEGDHGDSSPFDGPSRRGRAGRVKSGSVLAHAYFPTNGDMHFDQADNFTDAEEGYAKKGINQGINLFTIAAHEIGHLLGLRHPFSKSNTTSQTLASEDQKQALMAPYFRGYRSDMLGVDDKAGIEHIYGSGVGGVWPVGSKHDTK